MQLVSGFNEFNSARFENPEFARIVVLMQDPDKYEITEIEAAMMSGAAYHLLNVLWTAQFAHDNGLLDRQNLTNYRNDLAGSFNQFPGLIPYYIAVHEGNLPEKQNAYVFEPLARIAAELQAEPIDVD